MKERKRRSVLQSAKADGDGMRRPPGHLWLLRRELRETLLRRDLQGEVLSVSISGRGTT